MQIKHHLPAAATFRLSTGLLSRRRALAGLCLAWPVACAAATDSESPPLQPQKVADGIWFVQGETALGTTSSSLGTVLSSSMRWDRRRLEPN
jgi:hypothetical protein